MTENQQIEALEKLAELSGVWTPPSPLDDYNFIILLIQKLGYAASIQGTLGEVPVLSQTPAKLAELLLRNAGKWKEKYVKSEHL